MPDKKDKKYAIGLDFGTNSVRALLVNLADGRETGSAVWNYATGDNGIILDKRDPDMARQHPRDYLTGIERTVKDVLRQGRRHKGFAPDKVAGKGSWPSSPAELITPI